MDKKMLTWLAVGIAIGLVAGPKLRQLPVLKSFPTV